MGFIGYLCQKKKMLIWPEFAVCGQRLEIAP